MRLEQRREARRQARETRQPVPVDDAVPGDQTRDS